MGEMAIAVRRENSISLSSLFARPSAEAASKAGALQRPYQDATLL